MEVFKQFKPKKYYKSDDYDFEAEKGKFKTLEGLVQLKHSIGNCIGILWLHVIPESLGMQLYKVASWLESQGNFREIRIY